MKKLVLSGVVTLALGSGTPDVWALPHGESVNHGNVRFERSGAELKIHQNSSKAIVDYESFNVAQGETVRFHQPTHSASILNRVHGGASTIAGDIHANGNVFLINRAGILFSSSARVNVRGLVASSMELSNSDFLNGDLTFSGDGALVANHGVLNGDFAYLVGSSVQNSGTITAPRVALAAGASSVKIDEAAGGEINLIIDGQAAASDAGGELESIDTPEGPSDPDPTEMNGEERTNDPFVSEETGGALPDPVDVEEPSNLRDPALETGDILNDGIIHASGHSGGHVAVAANRIAHAGSIHADGQQSNGGMVNVFSKESLILTDTAIITANAGEVGDGGDITLFTEGNAYFPPDATIEARGGVQSGEGGFVELSGIKHIVLDTIPDVGAVTEESAGTIYIDPTDIDIGIFTGPFGGSFNPAAPFSYTPTAATSFIDVFTVAALLDQGNVTISTTSSFNGPNQGRLRLLDDLVFGSIAPRKLTLLADNFIDIQGSIVQSVETGTPLDLELRANNGISISDASFDLGGGALSGSANENGGVGDFDLTNFNVFNTADISLKGNNFQAVNVNLGDAASGSIALEFEQDIRHNGGINSGSTLRLEAGNHIIVDNAQFSATGGIGLSADHDLSGSGDILTIPPPPTDGVSIGTDIGKFFFGSLIASESGPIALSGQNLDLTSATILNANGSSFASLLAAQNIDLRNPVSTTSVSAGEVYVQAGGTIELGASLTAQEQVLVSAGNRINATAPITGPNAQAPVVGLQALGGIGTANSPVIINSVLTIDETGANAGTFVVNQNTEAGRINAAASGDLGGRLPEPISSNPTPFIVIPIANALNVVSEILNLGPPVPLKPNLPTEPPPLLAEMRSIPEFGTPERQRIDRTRARSRTETPTAKVTAVQFSGYYFLHEKMQMSEYANDLDLYFIDHLVFGIAEITADPRIPVEVKDIVINGGPRPYQL